MTAPDRAPVVVEHRGCGGTRVHLVCDRCGEPVDVGDVRARPGPGARPDDRTIPAKAGQA